MMRVSRSRRSSGQSDERSMSVRSILSRRVSAEAEAGSTHSVYFNRGSVASQAYARDFLNTPPSAFTTDAQRKAAAA